MRKIYYAIVHKDADSCYGVTFPDAPGCISAGDTLEELAHEAPQALRLWAEAHESAGNAVPEPRGLDALMADRQVAAEAEGNMTMAVPLLVDAGRAVRVNISLDAGMLEAIDLAASERGLTRSAFLASAARDKIEG